MTYTDEIQKLLDSDRTSYSIAKATGLSPQYVDNYRKGKSKLENMALGKAEILINYIEEINNMLTREMVENYLENYDNTLSTEMDGMFNRFKSDVSSLAKEYKKDELYVYSREEWIEFLEELIEEAYDDEVKEGFEKQLEEFKADNDSVVLNDINGNTHYL